MALYEDAGGQIEPARPLYARNRKAPLHSRDAQVAGPRYLNSRASANFDGADKAQARIIAKTVPQR